MTRALVLVPLKRFAMAKSRLAVWLTPRERRELQRAMARDLFAAVRAVRPRLELVIVAQDAREARDLVGACGTVIGAPGRQGLSADLAHATSMLATQIAKAHVVVLPADVPTAEPADISALFAALRDVDVVIAPDRHGQGTNALGFHLDHVGPFRFGVGSFARHVDAAKAAGARVRVVTRQRLALDVDDMDDLRLVMGAEGAPATQRVLMASALADRPALPVRSAEMAT